MYQNLSSLKENALQKDTSVTWYMVFGGSSAMQVLLEMFCSHPYTNAEYFFGLGLHRSFI